MKSPDVFIGIDPGVSGAIVMVNKMGKIVDWYDMPYKAIATKQKKKGFGNSITDSNGLSKILWNYDGEDSAFGIIERITPWPGIHATINGTMMHSRGVCEGVLAALGIPFVTVPPQTWKRYYGLLKTTKSESLVCCKIQLDWWTPMMRGNKKLRHTNRAEAALIGNYGRLLKLYEAD